MWYNNLNEKLDSLMDYFEGNPKTEKEEIEKELKKISNQCNKFYENYKGIIKIGFVTAGTLLVIKYATG